MTKRWFCSPIPRPQAPTQLICLPHAGGGAAAFHGWAQALGPGIEVLTVVLPGRENRIAEPAEVDPTRLAEVITERADRPYALYGHSMGGWLGFEVIRALRRGGHPLPYAFYIGAARPPDLPDRDGYYDGLSAAPPEQLLARLTEAGAIPAGVLAEPDLVELLLPALYADFGWLDNYRYTAEPALPVPLVGFAARADPVVPSGQMPGWARHTAAGFTLHTLDGPHLFQLTNVDTVTAVIRDGVPSPAGAR